jgi:hypothetical protein
MEIRGHHIRFQQGDVKRYTCFAHPIDEGHEHRIARDADDLTWTKLKMPNLLIFTELHVKRLR